MVYVDLPATYLPQKGRRMNRIFIALGSQEKFAKLGAFNVTVDGDEVDLYYNLDLGDHRTSMFDVDSGTYKDLAKAHRSFHYSGRGHFKETTKRGTRPLFIGHISDGSVLNSPDKDPLILGVESFFFDLAATAGATESNTLFLRPPNGVKQYSVLWLWMPADALKIIPPRWFYVNLWHPIGGYDTFRTAAIADMAITRETQTILTVNGWEVRALFLKTLLPVMIQGVILAHPQGKECPWRAWASLDAHLPLSQMVRFEAFKKKPLITTEHHKIAEEARTPSNWVKKKEVADGTNSTN